MATTITRPAYPFASRAPAAPTLQNLVQPEALGSGIRSAVRSPIWTEDRREREAAPMLEKVVEYLRLNGIPFRLESYPSPEPLPNVARPPTRPQSGTMTVDTWILFIDGRLSLAAVPSGERMDLFGLRANLGAEMVREASVEDLVEGPFVAQGLPAPPLGRLFGVPVLVDRRVADAQVICFAAFAPYDFIEVAYDDFARVEQPRVADFIRAGELPEAPSYEV
jgi:Ala-tRNA(Pro) deacylase